MVTIRISDKTNGFLTLDLADILRIVGDASVRTLHWRVYELECTPARLAENLAATHQVHGNMPIDINGDELLAFANAVKQTEMGLFLASATPWLSFSGDGTYSPMRSRLFADLVVEVFDATYWTVSTSRIEVISDLSRTFKQTEIFDGRLL